MKNIQQIVAAILLTCSIDAFAVKVGGIDIPETQGNMKLQGAGLLRKGIFFKIYVGALYLEETNHVNQVLENVPKRLDIHYFHHTPKKYMIRTAEKTLQKNLSPDEYKKLAPSIDKLHKAYRDGKKGSYASIIFHPDKGLTYAFDGKIVVNIPDNYFANNYYKIWLGEQPSSRTIKNALLKKFDE